MAAPRVQIRMDDLRTNYGLYYLAMNPTFGYTYYQQVILSPVFDGIVRGDPQFNRVINIEPFRHSKTTLGTINFVPYYFGHHPTATIMVLAYNHKRARGFGRAIRDIMQKAPLYQALFPESQIAKTSRAADEFETVSGGHFYAGGFDTGINGIGASGCIAEGQRVCTQRGWLPIELVVVGDMVATPWAWQRVERAQCNGVKPVVRVGIGSEGLILTADHRILSESGWVAAGNLRKGDRVYGVSTMPGSVRAEGQAARPGQATEVLLESMLRKGLFNGASEAGQGAKAEGISTEATGYSVPYMRGGVPPRVAHNEVLFAGVQESSACGVDGWGGEPELQGRGVYVVLPTPLSQTVVPRITGDVRGVFRVWDGGQVGGASPRREQAERYDREHRGPLPTMSHAVSQVQEYGVARVYDLQVAGDHCFCTESIYTHNCIIDDPHKNKEDVTSDACVTKWQSVYDNVISNRCEPGAWILMNTTRWAPGDLPGWRMALDGAFDYLRGGVPYKDGPERDTVH